MRGNIGDNLERVDCRRGIVARMERKRNPGIVPQTTTVPDCASLHPGYAICLAYPPRSTLSAFRITATSITSWSIAPWTGVR
jgi:hypothetical protein